MLVERGADVNAENSYGKTPVYYGKNVTMFLVFVINNKNFNK